MHYRITESEYRMIETLAAIWAEKLRAQGVPLTGDNRNAWFRSVVGELRKQAEAQGVTFELGEPSKVEPPVPEPSKVEPPASEPSPVPRKPPRRR